MPVERYAKNAPGDFYVEKDCCITCGVWESVGSNLIGWEEDTSLGHHCYVKQQPRTPAEIGTMMEVLHITDADCFRYAGEDPVILQNVVTIAGSSVCDSPRALDLRPIPRLTVRFVPLEPALAGPEALAASLSTFVLTTGRWGSATCSVKPLDVSACYLEFTWHQDYYHRVEFRRVPNAPGFELTLRPRSGGSWISLASFVSNWLAIHGTHIEWLSDDDLDHGAPGAPTFY